MLIIAWKTFLSSNYRKILGKCKKLFSERQNMCSWLGENGGVTCREDVFRAPDPNPKIPSARNRPSQLGRPNARAARARPRENWPSARPNSEPSRVFPSRPEISESPKPECAPLLRLSIFNPRIRKVNLLIRVFCFPYHMRYIFKNSFQRLKRALSLSMASSIWPILSPCQRWSAIWGNYL